MFLDAWINHDDDENYNNRFQRPFLSRVSIACTDKLGAMHKAYQLELSALGLEKKGRCTRHFSLQTMHGPVGSFAAHMSRCTLLWRINYCLCTWVSIIKTCLDNKLLTRRTYFTDLNKWYPKWMDNALRTDDGLTHGASPWWIGADVIHCISGLISDILR
jgi:hypothetical protein